MDKLYLIDYRVDTGVDFVRDQALVFAFNEMDALYKVTQKIEDLSYENSVNRVYEIVEFTGDCFSKKFNLTETLEGTGR